MGHTFKPLGGQNDGGADGFVDSDIRQHANRTGVFFQSSKELDPASKIRRTVKRLRDVGREPRTLYYASSRVVHRIDEMQDKLTEELDVNIRIYDRNYFEVHANENSNVQASFDENLSSSIAFIAESVAPSFPTAGIPPAHREVSAFLGQEVNRKVGTTKTLESVTDALILWALEGTDPTGRMMTIEDIIAKVENVVPTAKRFFRGEIRIRLRKLVAKTDGERQVNIYGKQGLYCLPFESRRQIEKHNLEEEALKAAVSSGLEQRISTNGGSGYDGGLVTDLVNVLHKTLETVFEQQGFDVSNHFLAEQDPPRFESRPILEIAENELNNIDLRGEKLADLMLLLRTILRDVFYRSSLDERMYLGRLSRTYMLLFTIRNTPEVINYFNTMSKTFQLYLGSDLIIRAISEYFLAPEDQITVNAIRIIKQAGSSVILSESMLEEVHSHIYASHLEYENYYHDIDSIVDLALASQSDRILIRAYYYAKLESAGKDRPATWSQYLNNFLSVSKLQGSKSAASLASLRSTLCHRFGLRYETKADGGVGILEQDQKKLSKKIKEMRPAYKKDELAENDANLILRVDYLRKSQEDGSGNPFGYKTWYLTQDTISGAATSICFPRRRGTRYVMRPEFLINYIANNPSNAEVRDSMRNIFPSILGVRLGSRLKDDHLQKLLQVIKEATLVDAARAQALVGEHADALKSNNLRQFAVKYNLSR